MIMSFVPQMHGPHRETMNGRSFKKLMNILEKSPPQSEDLTTTLFLGDLSITCDEGNLFELFSRFGVVESVQLKKSERDPQRAHLGFGFIKFATRDSAERALQEMNGYFFLGRAMRVGWALNNGERYHLKEKAPDPKKNQTAQIHVMFVTSEVNRRVSELDIGAAFRRYGNLLDVAIKKIATNHEYGMQSGYAFLHFSLTPEGLKSALTAVEEGHNLTFNNITYECKLTHTLQTHLFSMQHSQMSHILPTGFVDPPFKTHNSRPELTHSLDPRGYSENSFHSYAQFPTSNGYADHSHEGLSPSRQVLYHVNPFKNEGSSFSRTHKKISDHRRTMHVIPPSFTPHTSTNLDHYYEQLANPSSSSFISSSSIRQMMSPPYDHYPPQIE